MFGEIASPSFTVHSGQHIDAVVPPSATAGQVNIHIVLAPLVGRASLWGGYTYVDGPAASAPSAPGALTPVASSATSQIATSVTTRLPVPRAALQLIGSGKSVTLKVDMEELQLAGANSAVVSVTLQKRFTVKFKTATTKKGKPRKSKIVYRKIDSALLGGADVAAFTKIKIKSGYYRLVVNLEDSSKVVSKRFSITKKQISKTIRSSRA